MRPDNKTLKLSAVISLAAMAVLVIAAAVFAQERILFSDSAYKTFEILRTGHFSIEEMRYGSFISQLFPWLGQKLGWSVATIVLVYSVSFNLFFLAVAGFLYSVREYRLSIIMAGYYFLLVSDSYFWPNNEIHQAVAWMFVLLGSMLYLGRKRAPKVFIILTVGLFGFLAVFSHFIVILPLGFLWGYLWLEKENWPFSRSFSWLLAISIVSVLVTKYLLTASQSYDAPHLHHVTHASLKDVILSFTTPAVRMFLLRCATNYWITVLLFVAGMVALYRRHRLLFGYTVLALIGYFILIGLTYADFPDKPGNLYLFHIETEWASLGIIMAAPFVCALLPYISGSRAALLLAVIFIVRMGYISAAIPRFTYRTQFRARLLTAMRQKHLSKLAIYHDRTITDPYILEWALPFETVLTSIIIKDTQRTAFFINRDDKQAAQDIQQARSFYNAWGTMNWTAQSKYLAIDTTTPYTIMTYDSLMK